MEPVPKRIPGLDVARALAILGMVAVNFEVVLSNQMGPLWLQRVFQLPQGRASALFVVLAGIGMTLLVGDETARGRGVMLRRALFLMAAGYPFVTVWDGDILHFYGYYFLIGALIVSLPDALLAFLAALTVLVTPVLLALGFDFEAGWVLDRLEYTDLWTWEGHTRHLLFNGFHPLFPWMAFVMYGMWLGRRLRRDSSFAEKIALPAALVATVIELGSYCGVRALGGLEANELAYFVATVSMPPNPLYVVSAAALATAVLGASSAVARRWPDRSVVLALTHTGQLALTAYLLHVVVGIGVFDTFLRLGSLSIGQVFAWWATFCYLTVIGAHLWRRRFRHGPAERLMRSLTDIGKGG